ncbi:MAG TPA: hypothetical protein VLK33_19840 [Terriglobales bacterium]|nr:hypothetical protein [Terriglobales bacterium]
MYLSWAIEHGFRFDIHDNLKDLSGIQAPVDSSAAAAQSQLGPAIGATSGNLSASDNAIVADSGNVTTTINETDPGVVKALEAISGDNAYVSGLALETAGAALGNAGALTAQALKQAGDLSAQETKTPIQQIYPLLLIGAVVVVAVIYFATKGK